MDSTLVWACTYVLSLGLFAVLALRRAVDSERRRILPAVVSFVPLVAAGAARLALTGHGPLGAFALGAALNLALVIGTGLDPLNAAVRWPGDASSYRSARPLRHDGVAARRRGKSAALPLGLFVVLAVTAFVVRPDWFV